tara:strand:+ start:4237 stop:4995 length:759 start_codon:yes stop_codon:yes gene_type:complete
LPEYKIQDLPDRFFKFPKYKKFYDGVLESETDIDEVGRLKIVNKPIERKVSNIFLKIGQNVTAKLTLFIPDSSVRIEIGDSVRGTIRINAREESVVIIGENTSANEVKLYSGNGEILIGNDCMISDEVVIQCGDQHSIFSTDELVQINMNKKRLTIGNHVWLGRRTSVIGNVKIGTGSIIGMCSVVVKNIPEFSVAAGYPAKVIKENVSWGRPKRLVQERIPRMLKHISEGMEKKKVSLIQKFAFFKKRKRN